MLIFTQHADVCLLHFTPALVLHYLYAPLRVFMSVFSISVIPTGGGCDAACMLSIRMMSITSCITGCCIVAAADNIPVLESVKP